MNEQDNRQKELLDIFFNFFNNRRYKEAISFLEANSKKLTKGNYIIGYTLIYLDTREYWELKELLDKNLINLWKNDLEGILDIFNILGEYGFNYEVKKIIETLSQRLPYEAFIAVTYLETLLENKDFNAFFKKCEEFSGDGQMDEVVKMYKIYAHFELKDYNKVIESSEQIEIIGDIKLLNTLYIANLFYGNTQEIDRLEKIINKIDEKSYEIKVFHYLANKDYQNAADLFLKEFKNFHYFKPAVILSIIDDYLTTSENLYFIDCLYKSKNLNYSVFNDIHRVISLQENLRIKKNINDFLKFDEYEKKYKFELKKSIIKNIFYELSRNNPEDAITLLNIAKQEDDLFLYDFLEAQILVLNKDTDKAYNIIYNLLEKINLLPVTPATLEEIETYIEYFYYYLNARKSTTEGQKQFFNMENSIEELEDDYFNIYYFLDINPDMISDFINFSKQTAKKTSIENALIYYKNMPACFLKMKIYFVIKYLIASKNNRVSKKELEDAVIDGTNWLIETETFNKIIEECLILLNDFFNVFINLEYMTNDIIFIEKTNNFLEKAEEDINLSFEIKNREIIDYFYNLLLMYGVLSEREIIYWAEELGLDKDEVFLSLFLNDKFSILKNFVFLKEIEDPVYIFEVYKNNLKNETVFLSIEQITDIIKSNRAKTAADELRETLKKIIGEDKQFEKIFCEIKLNITAEEALCRICEQLGIFIGHGQKQQIKKVLIKYKDEFKEFFDIKRII